MSLTGLAAARIIDTPRTVSRAGAIGARADFDKYPLPTLAYRCKSPLLAIEQGIGATTARAHRPIGSSPRV